MRLRLFTFLMMFLAIAGNAVWGQENADPIFVDVEKLTNPSPADAGYTVSKETDNNTLTITKAGSYYFKAEGTGINNTNVQFIVQENLGDVSITFDNVKTDAQLGDDLNGSPEASKYPEHCAFEINKGNKVTVNWIGENKFWSGPKRAGINVKPGATLILDDQDNIGTLEAGSLCNSNAMNTYGAGIGGDSKEANFGEIIIENGNIKARCESKGNKIQAWAAGIGGGYGEESAPNKPSQSGSILIKGGTIEAASWSATNAENYENDKVGNEFSYGAGIGGGYKGTCSSITILGGTVIANSGKPNESGNPDDDDIGVGMDYNNDGHPGIIIGNWDEDTGTKVTGLNNATVDVDETNYLDGLKEFPTLTGNVSMPDYTQLYLENKPKKDGSTEINTTNFSAYNISIKHMKIESDHEITNLDQADEIVHYYLGAKQSLTIDALECEYDWFLGYFHDADDVINVNAEDKTTFTAPDNSNDFELNKWYHYCPVKVDK